MMSSREWIHVIYSPIFFIIVPHELGQSPDCPNASAATLKNRVKQTSKKPQQYTNCVHELVAPVAVK